MPEPIPDEHIEAMNALAGAIDDVLNGPQLPGLKRARKVGFVLLTANFGEIDNGRVNYISNGNKADMIAMVKEYLARLEGRAGEGGHA